MSSSGYRSIFKHAAALTREVLASEIGSDKYLDFLIARAPEEEADPRKNRRYFIEPVIDSQIAGVPLRTAELVALALLRYNVLRTWVRVHCPDSKDEQLAFETDCADDLQHADNIACENCRGFHEPREITWEHIETLYAFGRGDGGDPKDGFDPVVSRDVEKLDRMLADGNISSVERCVLIAPVETTSEAALFEMLQGFLSQNVVVAEPRPESDNLGLRKLLLILLASFIVYSLVLAFSVFVLGDVWGAVVTGVFIVGMVLYAFVHRQTKLAPSAVERGVITIGGTMSMATIAYGATGVFVKASWGQERPWDVEFNLGEQNWPVIILGLLMLVSTFGSVIWLYKIRMTSTA